jgi:hypothetical protein
MTKRRARAKTVAGAPDMPDFRTECGHLAPLETFDPAAFRGGDDVPQAVCNFVLALALIYNDCKDAIYAHVVLAGLKPAGPRRTRLLGAVAGAQLHAFRAIAGLLHELFELIRANDDVLRHPFFVSLVQRLHPVSREAWASLVNVAQGATPTDPLGKKLLRLRNKVFFHYDAKALATGYVEHFFGPHQVDERAYVSRGHSMRSTRFFFADAAATGYVKHLVGEPSADTLIQELGEIVDRINHGLMLIVGQFIQRRGYSFRSESET